MVSCSILSRLDESFITATHKSLKRFDIRQDVEPQSVLYMIIKVMARYAKVVACLLFPESLWVVV